MFDLRELQNVRKITEDSDVAGVQVTFKVYGKSTRLEKPPGHTSKPWKAPEVSSRSDFHSGVRGCGTSE